MSQTSLLLCRRRLILLSGLGLVSALAGCSTTSVLSSNDDGASGDETADALPMVNSLRARKGLSPLAVDPVASQAAAYQAKRMAKAGKMSHLIGFNDDFGRRMKDHGVALPAAENIAAGQNETGRAVQAWIDSPKHLHNMLGDFRGLGVAVARNSSSGNRPYWAMVLSS